MVKAPWSMRRRLLDCLFVLLVQLVWIPTMIALNSWLLQDCFPHFTQKNASFLEYASFASVLLVESTVLGLVLFLILRRRRTTQGGLRWYQFSLRGLLVLMLLANIAMVPVAIRMQRANRQRVAAEVVRKLGGSLSYDGLTVTGELPAPAWLAKLLGSDFFVTVGGVRLDKTKVADADLETLKNLPQLHWLNLADTEITDAGLANLKGLANLQWLLLNHNRVTDAGLANLKELPQIASLYLMNAQVTDAGLEHLQV